MMKTKRSAKGTHKKTPLGKEERENLLACMTEGLRDESDNVLESIVEVVQDLKQNEGMREALESFHKNGWAFIQKTGESKNEFKLDEATLSSVVVLDKPNQNLAKASRSSSLLDQETHPMHNDVIVKNVFEYSSVDSLKNCRLVSTKWRDLSLSSWRGKAVLRVNKVVKGGDAEDFIQDGSEFREIPFKKYRLFYGPREVGFCFDTDTKKAFLKTFRLSIQSMHLSSEDVKTMFSLLTKLPNLSFVGLEFDVEDFSMEYESIISEGGECPFQNLRPATSKLRELELKLSVTENGGYETGLRFPWKKVFERVPSIESLCVKYKLDKGYRHRSNGLHVSTLEDIIESVCEARVEGDFSTLNLEQLDILATQHPLRRNRFTVDIATNIIESQLPLRSLGIHLGTGTIGSNRLTISNLLEAHAETLQSLTCDSDPNARYLTKEVLKLPLPPFLPAKVLLPNLKELVFITGCVWAFHVLGSLDVPELESLRIEPKKCMYKKETDQQLDLKTIVFRSGQFCEGFSGASFIPNLKKFFYDGPKRFNAAELQGLGKAMPNVTDLRIPFCDIDAFPAVYELWPGLQSLHVILSERSYLQFDDYAITCLSVAGESYSDEDGISAEYRVSNITNLRDLRKFVLEARLVKASAWPRRPLITDLSAAYGFLQLPKLRILQLETLCKFSARIEAALESHVLECKVHCPETVNDSNPWPIIDEEEEDTDDDNSRSDNYDFSAVEMITSGDEDDEVESDWDELI